MTFDAVAMLLASLLLVPVLVAQPAVSASASATVQRSKPCSATAISTGEINECLAEQLRDARKRLGRYLGFVKRSMHTDTATLRQLEAAQRTWETFVVQDCDAVYSHWRDGSIRGAMSLGCSIDAVAHRTHDLWDRYLKFQDATPPVLPEPKGGMLSRAEIGAPIITANTPARVSWKMIATKDPLNPASARHQLPKGIAWTAASLAWDVLPTSYDTDGNPKGPFTLSTMNPSSAPIRAEIKHVSSNRVVLTLRRTRSAEAIYESTFTLTRDRSIAQIISANDGESILELIRVVCGDRDRFDVFVRAHGDEAAAVGECSASAAVSPDNRYVVLEQGIVDLFEREFKKFPDPFPQFGQVVAWSKDGRHIVLNRVGGLVVVTRR